MSEATFRTFEADPANELANRLAQAVAGLDATYSPVVLFGDQGSGKSHLLTAIATDLRVRHPDVSYLFLSEVAPIEYLLSQQTDEDVADQGYMYRPYADQQVLLVDDIERFGSNGLRERFEQLFDAFFDSNRLVVVACSGSPNSLAGFDERFISRLNSGVTAEVGLPGPDARLRILKQEAEQLQFAIDSKTLRLLAELPVHTVGHLVDLLRQVRMFCVVTAQNPTAQVLQPLIADVAGTLNNGETIAAEEWCAKWYAQQLTVIEGKNKAELNEARDKLATLEASIAEHSSGTSQAKQKIAKAAEALRQRDTEIEQLRADLEKAQHAATAEIPRLQELLGDKDTRLHQLQAELEQERQQFQAKLAEAVRGGDANQAALKEEAKQKAAEHAAEVEALEQRLEEIYTSLNDAQQEFAIQNQNKDKLLEKLSNDFQSAKSEGVAAKKQIAELEAHLMEARSAAARGDAVADEAVKELEAHFVAKLETAKAEIEQAAERRIAALQREHEHALATAGDETAMENEELRRQVEAKEGVLRTITEDLHSKTQAVETARAAAATHEARVTELEKALAVAAKAGETATADLKKQVATLEGRLLTAETTAKETAAAAKEALAAETARVAQLQTELAGQQARATELQEQLHKQELTAGDQDSLNAELHARNQELVAIREEMATLKSRLEAAEQREQATASALETERAAHDALASESRATAAQTAGDLAAAKDQLAAKEQELATLRQALREAEAAGGAADPEQLRELQGQLEAREQTLQGLQQNFAAQLEEAGTKAREKETMLTGTVRDLQAQLNQLRISHDDQETQSNELQKEIVTLRAKLEQAQLQLAQASGGAPAAGAAEAPAAPAAPAAADAPAVQPPAPTAPPPPLETLAIPSSSALNAHFTFDTYQPTDAGAFSLRSAQQITQTPGELYNPFVLYGPRGCGKTHILHAMGNAILEENSSLDVAYIGVHDLMAALAGLPPDTDLDTVALEPDVLLIDDFLIEDLRPEDQLRLSKVLSNFVHDGRQLTLASEVPPVKISSIERELLRFLEEGLLVKFDLNTDVAPPPAQEAPAPREEPTAPPTIAEPISAAPPHVPDDFDAMLQLDGTFLRDQYRGPKAFDDFLEAYQSPNSNRRTRFPLIVVEEDRGRRYHFFHALGNELHGMFRNAVVALLSFEALGEALRKNPKFDVAALTKRILQADIVLLNDGEAVNAGSPELVETAQAIMGILLQRQKLFTLGLSRADKRDKIFGETFRAGTKKKI